MGSLPISLEWEKLQGDSSRPYNVAEIYHSTPAIEIHPEFHAPLKIEPISDVGAELHLCFSLSTCRTQVRDSKPGATAKHVL